MNESNLHLKPYEPSEKMCKAAGFWKSERFLVVTEAETLGKEKSFGIAAF